MVDVTRAEAVYERAESEGWVDALARDAAFIRSGRPEELEVVRQFLVRQLNEEIDAKGESRGAIRRLAAVARRRFSELRQTRSDELVDRVAELAAELAGQHADWLTCTVNIREAYAKRYFVENFGFAHSAPVRQVARFRPTSNQGSLP